MRYSVIGLMSGSSLDGLDVAHCEFILADQKWGYEILKTECIEYSEEWVDRLKKASSLSGKQLQELDGSYAALISKMVRSFIDNHEIKEIDLVAMHGHTVFHFPEKFVSYQLGNGGIVSAMLALPVVSDLRSTDIALGGQGTPMVAISDLLLFDDYDILINIGGIANMTYMGRKTQSFDICVANQVLNKLSKDKGLDYDQDGKLAGMGKLNNELLDKLNSLEFYRSAPPKSLDNSFTTEVLMPLIQSFQISTEDKLATYCRHIIDQIEQQLNQFRSNNTSKILITGGGAFNKYLISLFDHDVIIAEPELISYKEALATAFSGLLRLRGEDNFISQITGADKNTCAGALYKA